MAITEGITGDVVEGLVVDQDVQGKEKTIAIDLIVGCGDGDGVIVPPLN